MELERKLARRGYSPDEIDSAMSRLDELGYVDDRSFAESHVRRRQAAKGPFLLLAELVAAGISRADAEAVMESYGPAGQLKVATRLAERLYAQKPPSSYREMLDGIGSKLLRRGFSAITVRAACRSVMAGTPPVGED